MQSPRLSCRSWRRQWSDSSRQVPPPQPNVSGHAGVLGGCTAPHVVRPAPPVLAPAGAALAFTLAALPDMETGEVVASASAKPSVTASEPTAMPATLVSSRRREDAAPNRERVKASKRSVSITNPPEPRQPRPVAVCPSEWRRVGSSSAALLEAVEMLTGVAGGRAALRPIAIGIRGRAAAAIAGRHLPVPAVVVGCLLRCRQPGCVSRRARSR